MNLILRVGEIDATKKVWEVIKAKQRVAMADVVQYSLEWRVNELDVLESRGIFMRVEIVEIVKQHRKFEYCLKRSSPVKEDFLAYMNYEVKIDELRLRRKAMSRQSDEKRMKSISDLTGVAKVVEIYRLATMRYKGDINLWFRYLEFCRMNKNGLRVCPNSEDVQQGKRIPRRREVDIKTVKTYWLCEAEISQILKSMVHVNTHQNPTVVQDITYDFVKKKHVQENHAVEKHNVLSESFNGSEDEQVSAIEEAQASEIVNEASINVQKVGESDSRTGEVPKRSHTSIVKVVKENVVLLSTSKTPTKVEPTRQEEQVINVLLPTPFESGENEAANGNVQDNKRGPSIYLKSLPLDATPALLDNEFQKFGLIRTNEIQVRSQKGFCFGFVEFESSSSMQSAIETSPIILNGQQVMKFEDHGYMMNGSRHKRMNVVRMRKESQVYNAEDKRALAMSKYEEKAKREAKVTKREAKVMSDLSQLVQGHMEKVVIRIDNQSAILLIKNLVFHGRSKHIHTKYHFIKECVEDGQVKIEHDRGNQQKADILTKAFGRIKFNEDKRWEWKEIDQEGSNKLREFEYRFKNKEERQIMELHGEEIIKEEEENVSSGNVSRKNNIDVINVDEERDEDVHEEGEDDASHQELRRLTRITTRPKYLEDSVQWDEIEGEKFLLAINDEPWNFEDAKKEKVMNEIEEKAKKNINEDETSEKIEIDELRQDMEDESIFGRIKIKEMRDLIGVQDLGEKGFKLKGENDEISLKET